MRILGLEFGSTRIKAVLIDETGKVLAQGGYDWENILVDGLWSYNLDEVWTGFQSSYRKLVENYGQKIETLDAIGISAMMHGYIPTDDDDRLLAPYRTWRNTNAHEASEELSELFRFHVPMRWSVSQYYQSVLEKLDHVKNIRHLNTLAGYVHYHLTGKRVLGINDASGMFPIDDDRHYDRTMLEKFNNRLRDFGLSVDFEKLLPEVLVAGENAGYLTEEGAKLLDPSGVLRAGCPLCPPEGDMGTGMICTNCVEPKTANMSLGTSANLTVVLEKNMKNYYPAIDVIQTPSGAPAALVHANTCTSVIDSWVNLFSEVIELSGGKADKGKLFPLLFNASQESDDKVGNLSGYNFLAGEPLADTYNGAPMVFSLQEGKMNLANFMQMQIYSAIASLALGMDILKEEKVKVDLVYGHGGYFKTPMIGQKAVSALVNAPAVVMDNAGEGGAWGIALLAVYMLKKKGTLAEFLNGLMSDVKRTTVNADEKDKIRFDNFMKNYKAGLPAERLISKI
jgi:sugar (pentulose or hexulose) kinase